MLSQRRTHSPLLSFVQLPIWSLMTISCLAIISCLTTLPSEARKLAKPNLFPATGKVLKLTNGDLMCYVDLLDSRGRKHTLGADFTICDRTQFVNQMVSLTYRIVQVNHCEGNDRCGKTIAKNLIIRMKLIRRR
jgi:hypothetical protein